MKPKIPISLDNLDDDDAEQPQVETASEVAPTPVKPEAASVLVKPTAESAATVVDELPNDLRGLFNLLSELEKLPERTSRERSEKERRMNPVKLRWFQLQQIPPPPAMDADSMAGCYPGKFSLEI